MLRIRKGKSRAVMDGVILIDKGTRVSICISRSLALSSQREDIIKPYPSNQKFQTAKMGTANCFHLRILFFLKNSSFGRVADSN